MHKCSETGLILDNEERNSHLTTKSWDPHYKFNWINIAGNKNKFSLLFFDESGDVFKSEFDLVSGTFWSSRTTCLGGSGFLDTLFLGSRSFRTVLVEQGENGHGFVLSNSLGEKVNGRRNLQTLVKDSTLTLDADVTRPLYKSAKITATWTDGSSNSLGTRAGRKHWVCLLRC